MANTVYVVGHQPVDIITKKLKLVDIMNVVTTRGVVTNNMLKDVTNYLNSLEFEMDSTDFILLNSAHNIDIINGLSRQNVIVYDPGLSTDKKEVNNILRSLVVSLGSNDINRVYRDTINSVRASITAIRNVVDSDVYFNCLTLLSDLNHTDVEPLEAHIMGLQTTERPEFTSKAIFLGDVIEPAFFKDLESKGINVVRYFPYELFLKPVDDIVTAYVDNPYYQRMLLHMKTELRSAIAEYHPQYLILNPGGIYLSAIEADLLVEAFKNDLTIYKLPGTYQGANIQL